MYPRAFTATSNVLARLRASHSEMCTLACCPGNSYLISKASSAATRIHGGIKLDWHLSMECASEPSQCYDFTSTQFLKRMQRFPSFGMKSSATKADRATGGVPATNHLRRTKSNSNGFRCKPKPKPPATKELAIERYALEYPPATICEPLKLNSPFQCTRNVEVPATTRLSLSVAAAQAVFAVSGIILVALLRKLSKPAETSSGDDELRSVVRKLRITVDKLSTSMTSFRPTRTSSAPARTSSALATASTKSSFKCF